MSGDVHPCFPNQDLPPFTTSCSSRVRAWTRSSSTRSEASPNGDPAGIQAAGFWRCTSRRQDRCPTCKARSDALGGRPQRGKPLINPHRALGNDHLRAPSCRMGQRLPSAGLRPVADARSAHRKPPNDPALTFPGSCPALMRSELVADRITRPTARSALSLPPRGK